MAVEMVRNHALQVPKGFKIFKRTAELKDCHQKYDEFEMVSMTNRHWWRPGKVVRFNSPTETSIISNPKMRWLFIVWIMRRMKRLRKYLRNQHHSNIWSDSTLTYISTNTENRGPGGSQKWGPIARWCSSIYFMESPNLSMEDWGYPHGNHHLSASTSHAGHASYIAPRRPRSAGLPGKEGSFHCDLYRTVVMAKIFKSWPFFFRAEDSTED